MTQQQFRLACFKCGSPSGHVFNLNFHVTPMDLQKKLATASGRGSKLASELLTFYNKIKSGKLATLEPFLPLMYAFNGKPVNLENHFPMEVLFDVNQTPDTTLICSRQVGKSMNMTLRTLTNSSFTPFWKPLVIAPFFETIRRLSADYYQALIDQSPAAGLFYNEGCTKQVLERSLPNKSRIRFTYAHRTGDRARGIPANENIFDEFQMMFPEVMTVITATMNASPYGNIVTCAGTPITNANILSRRFMEESSRSHWAIKCTACGWTNIASPEHDLMEMIGPLRDDISPKRPAIKCSKCPSPLYPWTGRWYHMHPEKRKYHLGLHVPCIILPEHCCNYDKWRTILKTLANNNIADYVKYNEILGIPFDDGVALLTTLDVKRHAILGPNRVQEALRMLELYNGRVAIGIDWGGRGMGGTSLTKVAVVGLRSDLTVDVIFGAQLPKDATSIEEAALIKYLYQMFRPMVIAHDNLGIGQRAEEMLVSAGIPGGMFMPMEYTGETQGVIMKQRVISDSSKIVFNVDKTRGLLHLVEAYKHDKLFTFNMDEAYHARDLLLDFTHIKAELRVFAHSVRSEMILIQAEPNQSDDFVHAVHHACNALWYNHSWPDLGSKLIITTPQDLSTFVTALHKSLDQATIEALGLENLYSQAT